MQLAIKAPKDLAAGLFFILVGVLGYGLVIDMPMGAAVRMGPGYIPKVLSAIVALFGVFIAGRSFVIQGEPLDAWKLRPLLIISASIFAFAALIDSNGLILAAIVLMIIGTIGGREFFWREMIIFSVIMAIGAVIIFHVALGLPMQVFPPWTSLRI
ncbi:MAG: tripartite tricarboxylate transporter TctB family protein [Alphaproteobacteria bacterium]|nr:tripartite tricarboxylate transporter TctB family protein [Alphaproteobacteria bacterium]